MDMPEPLKPSGPANTEKVDLTVQTREMQDFSNIKLSLLIVLVA